jgi:hypothetical protein
MNLYLICLKNNGYNKEHDVIEDLKLRFRQNQIEQEGNDPTVTGASYGTPHDLASMHMSQQ